MPNLHIVAEPRMTLRLVEAGAFADAPLVVVDVGARGGIEWFWKAFGDGVRVIAFEPDAEECARLQSEAPANTTYLPLALGARKGTQTLHVARFSAASSFHPNDPAWCGRFDVGESLVVDAKIEVATTTLREALAGQQADFIKLDVEGAELAVLSGADLEGVMGLVAEVRFTHRMSHCPTLAELDQFCRSHGFDLYDLDLYRYSRKALPYPYLYDYRDQADAPVTGPTVQGQPLTGDALYFRDGLDTRQPVKLACLFEVFGLNDCAAEVIQAHRASFEPWANPDELLDLLVPEIKGQRLSFREHGARHAAGDRLFRPTPGRRIPDPIVSHYDGVFTPSWTPPAPPPPLGLCERLRRWLKGSRT
jgi:FkbM family methyltransferase